jgi:hypothetical protein
LLIQSQWMTTPLGKAMILVCKSSLQLLSYNSISVFV